MIRDKHFQNNIFYQKIRNRPIKITEQAISKVRLIEFEGFRFDENLFIQNAHKELLRISKEKNNSQEVGILIDIIHWQSWIIYGSKNQVSLQDNPQAYTELKNRKKNSLLFIHNHPSTATFSGDDFKTFCYNESLYAMSVVGNNGVVYSLVKMADFDATVALDEYFSLSLRDATIKKHPNNGTIAMKTILKNSTKYKLIYKTGGIKNG